LFIGQSEEGHHLSGLSLRINFYLLDPNDLTPTAFNLTFKRMLFTQITKAYTLSRMAYSGQRPIGSGDQFCSSGAKEKLAAQ